MFKRLRRLLRIDPYPLKGQDEAVISAAIENAVDRTDPRIRLVRGYQKKLRTAVSHALAYADEIVTSVPGPIEVSKRSFGIDPSTHAFFASVEQLQRVFSLSREARGFFEAPENKERAECYGLLVMEKRERNILGAELRGDIIQKDVPQVTVSFTEHRILASAATDVDCRQLLTRRVFKDLIACAVEKILSVQVQRQTLENQQNRLKLQLRMLESRTQGLEDSLEAMEIRDDEKIKAVRQQLAGIEEELHGKGLEKAAARFTALEDYVALINEVLDRPGEYFRLREEFVRLNRIGIKTSATSSETSDEIPFAAVELGNSLRCVAILVKYPRSDMIPVDYYLKRAMLT